MLFKKFAVAAAIATTLAFVGCSKKEEAPAADAAASEAVEAATDATAAAADAAADATVTADAAASEPTVVADDATVVASEVVVAEASAAQ